MTRRQTKPPIPMSSAAKLAMVAAAALLLTGCAGLRPGVAAKVGDETITTKQVTDFASSFCSFLAKNEPGDKPSADIRKMALSLLVEARLAHDFAKQHDVTWNEGGVDSTLKSVGESVSSFSDEKRQAFLDNVRYVLEGSDIVAQAVGQVSDQAAFTAGRGQAVGAWAEEFGVEIDPRYGSWSGFQVDGESGSLSVPEKATAPNATDPLAGLPASQTCH